MANQIRVMLEIGPKGKKVVAVAPDWPGLERGAKTREAAIARLQSYLPRYTQVAKLAGMDEEFATLTTVDMVDHYPGTGSTDFWGISFAFSIIDRQDMSSGELERELTLMQACWAFFDDVRLHVSDEMQKGLRGGGRDRDQIVGHTMRTEQEWAKQNRAILEEARTLLLELATASPDDAEITFQIAVVHDNLGLERESIPFYLKALDQGLTGPDLERALMGLGSTYRGLGEYQQAKETLRRGISECPQNRAIQVFLAMTLYNLQDYKEAMELVLTNLMETTSDEKLQYFKRALSYYALHLDEI